MSNDLDFSITVNEITEKAAAIRDPQLVVIIEKWVAKLVSDPRGLNELNHLKLLKHMISNNRIGPPFIRMPPVGKLLPLSRYVNRLCSRPLPWTRFSDTGDWKITSYSRAVQTANDAQLSTTTSLPKSDGHLSGGGCSCGGKTKVQPLPVNDNDVCNPCLDSVLQNAEKMCLNFADDYKDLLDECLIPMFTDAERKAAGTELLAVLKKVNSSTTLQDFYFQVSQLTCDKGEMLMKVANNMIADFEVFVADVFESRAQHISDGLAKEQLAINEKYTFLCRRTLNRATMAMDYLKAAIPTFNWEKYQADPNMFMHKAIATHFEFGSKSGPAGDDELQSQMTDEEDDDPHHTTNKKLLYKLNWLRTEVNRSDCECQAMYEQQKCLTNSLSEYNAKLSSIQCKSSVEIGRLKDELTLLRQQSSNQSITIDRLMGTIQLAMKNKSVEGTVNSS
ncbi:uncharacterized protein LOC126893564 [Daktulosphaira vitifoliae]|uniref:uncharacterized protein LOC126893564 n=1 Tax=Daktulosphaira vitifoliae TaxID=58002 RepID=UPI0021AAF30D|nr:uncharacterized protein LOC126893564 [Daktulosphaira vitifoliae]